MDDLGLVQEFARNRSEDAFRQLVDRHLGMVYSAACRMVRDPHLAEEVAQNVFTTLAEKAGALAPPQVVAGWLYQTTRHHAMHAVRSEQRRRQREEQALVMQTSEDAAEKESVLEHLESAMAQLPTDARDVLVLRFLESRSFREVGEQLGISEDAARMRSGRALEELREVMGKEGIVATVALLTGAMTTGTTIAVPAGLGVAIVSTVLAGATTVAATTTGGTTTLMKLFSLKTAGSLVGAGAVAVATVYFVTQHQKTSPSSNNQPMIAANQTSSVSPVANDSAATKEPTPGPLANFSGKQVTGGPSATNQVSQDASQPKKKKGKGKKQATPSGATDLIEKARALLKEQKYGEARDLLNEALKIDPVSADAFLFLGDAFDGMRQLDKALTNYSRTIELRPRKAYGWYLRGRTYEKLEHFKSAVLDYDEAIERDPKLWAAYQGRGRSKYVQGYYDEAEEDLQVVLEHEPDNSVAKNLLAKINHPENPFDTIEKCNKAIAANPTNPIPYHVMGDKLRMIGRYEESLPYYTKALELNPRPGAYWYERGRSYEKLGRWAEAAADYSEFLRIQPASHVYHGYRANAYYHDGHYDKSLADLNRAITLQPGRANYYSMRARTFLALDKPREGLADCEKSLGLVPQNNFQALYWRAACREALNEPRAAIEDYSRIISEDENWFNTLQRRGEQYFNLREYTNAMRDFQRVMELQPKNEDAPYMAGRCAVHLGKDQQALELFAKVPALTTNVVDAVEYRGNAYAELKRWTNAVADYTEAIRRQPNLGRLYLNRGMINLCLGKMEAGQADGLKGLTCPGMGEAELSYFVLLASSAQRDLGKVDDAKKLLAQAKLGTTNVWPSPIIRCLRGDSTWEELLKTASTNAEQSEARAYVGWAELVAGRREEGLAKLQWVKDHAAKELFEYDIARYLLERNGARASEKKP